MYFGVGKYELMGGCGFTLTGEGLWGSGVITVGYSELQRECCWTAEGSHHLKWEKSHSKY